MNNHLIRKLLTLMTGTGLAQIISLFFIYILTFFYTPIDYKNYAVFVGIVTMSGNIVTLKYELAIPLVKKDSDAYALVYLSVTLTLILTAILTSGALFLNNTYFPDLKYFIILGGVTILFVGIYNTLFHWALRKDAFKDISITRINQSLIGGIVHTILGVLGFIKYGLAIGNFFNFNAGVFRLFKIFRASRICNINPDLQELKYIFFKYKKYPIYSSLESLFMTGSQHIPLILIGLFYGGKAGIFMLCSRILAAPIGLVGQNLQSLYLSEISGTDRESNTRKLTENIIFKTVILGNLPITLLSILGFTLADITFPENWDGLSEMFILISPWMNFYLLSKPFSIYFNYKNKQELNTYFNLIIFFIGVLILYFGYYIKLPYAIELFCISNFILYLIYYFLVSSYLKIKVRSVYLILLAQILVLISIVTL